LRKSVKSIKNRRENGVDTLKLHHDTLSKTLKKTLKFGMTMDLKGVGRWEAPLELDNLQKLYLRKRH